MAVIQIEEQKILDHLKEARRMARERDLSVLCYFLDMAIAEAEVIVENRSVAAERVVPLDGRRVKRPS